LALNVDSGGYKLPELPEVEVARLSISPYVVGSLVNKVNIYNKNLRWPVHDDVADNLTGNKIVTVTRRGKYLLLSTYGGTILIHLGMTGFIRILQNFIPPEKHDHFDIIFETNRILRFNDVRRFGSILWFQCDPDNHKLISGLGPEPLSDFFDGNYLFKKSRNRKVSIKQLLMDHHVVSGIGNIYANEALFHAGIRPNTQAGRISNLRYSKLVDSVKEVLLEAIRGGGTMLDFRDGNEKYGYFNKKLLVYGQDTSPCKACGSIIQRGRLGQRSFFFCKICQR
jgi:formamidopyrimidine-DNA glycosylase